jgi:AraC-like DNA-binding protein
MQRLVFSTDDVPEAERFSYWREAVGVGLLGFTAEPNAPPDIRFNARVVAAIGASVVDIRLRCDPCNVFRRTGDIARHGWEDYVCLYRQIGISARFDDDRREFVSRPGDLMIADPTMPFAGKARPDCDTDLWFFPRRLLDPHLPASRIPPSLVLPGQSGVGALVKAYLDAFSAQIDAVGDREADLVADNFCRLLAVACGASAGEQKEAIRLARLEEAKRYVGLHLADPVLTSEKAAAALKMSVRQLYLLFEPSGESFVRYVTRRRLEECRAALLNPVGGRSVTDIAFAWGFNNLATFNRNFRQAFGASAGELRSGASLEG